MPGGNMLSNQDISQWPHRGRSLVTEIKKDIKHRWQWTSRKASHLTA